MNISPARKSAFEILYKIEKEKAFSSILLSIYEENLDLKDRSLCHEIVLGVLRNKIYLDAIIKYLTNKALGKFDLEVLICLRIGLYQLKFLNRVPAYSAINESVNLVKRAKKKSASGLVNAVLRRASRAEIKLEFKDELEKISVETSHPKWLLEKWVKQFGWEETEKLAISNNKIPKLAFRFTAKYHSRDEQTRLVILNEVKPDIVESKLVENCYLVNKFSQVFKHLAEDGLIYFQDEGSQMISTLIDLNENESFLDLCASPGSKTSHIATSSSKHKNKGLIVAGDIYEHRVSSLKQNLINQSVGYIDLVRYDATTSLPFNDLSFNKVLIDAPCTGTGTIRSNPEIRYNLVEKDFADLSDKQLVILKNASKLIKQGGQLIYSTCSLEVEENEEVIARFLESDKRFEKIRPILAEEFLTKHDFARISPQSDETDGFFVAVLKRL